MKNLNMNILITDGMEKDAIEFLINQGFNVEEKFYPEEELGKKLQNVDVLVVRSATKVRADIIDEAVKGNRLKMIIRGGVGLDNIDCEYARTKGIEVRNTPGASSDAVAELVIGQLIVLARFINMANLTMREGRWEKKAYKGVEIAGKTLGLIGFGRIARSVAKKAKLLGMNIIYNDLPGCVVDDTDDYKFVTLDELYEKADFITMHVPLTKETKYMIDKDAINKMKDGVYLLNCARGGVINECDLLDALNEDKVAGAAIDVYEKEPTPNMDLLNHPKVSPTPHIGASTNEAQKRIGTEITEIILEKCDKLGMNLRQAL